ncbi:hypothetical protein ACIBO1_09515 [Micromonospora sp. NPDC049903]|uniref:hypothetical protein n=1 Tax=Micromonospora sp. NPDC049903 TaxID=3364276 RepID=UPI0037B3923B
MMSPVRLRELCVAVRKGDVVCDDTLVKTVEVDIDEYRGELGPQLPPDHLAELLPLMGWLIYEVSWKLVSQLTDGRREENPEVLAAIKTRYDLIARTVNAALGLPWPEYAPRALGALRAQALAESKRDTEESYGRARTAHQSARRRHGEFLTYSQRTAVGKDDGEGQLPLDEILVQLDLAETGTACRVAERVIGRWPEDFASADEIEYTQRLFDQLTSGVDIGEQALKTADRVWEEHGFSDEVTETRLLLPTSFINPGIMTARAVLLMLALTADMDKLGRLPLDDDQTWDATRHRLRKRFEEAYTYIERPIVSSTGEQVEPRDDLKLAIVQTRLSAALLMPGYRLPSTLSFASCLSHEVLDDDAVEAMCGWMTEQVTDDRGRQRQRSVHRGIGSAIMPRFLDSVEACRVAMGGTPGFRQWRSRWFVLDSYAREKGRAERVEKALGLPVHRRRTT